MDMEYVVAFSVKCARITEHAINKLLSIFNSLRDVKGLLSANMLDDESLNVMTDSIITGTFTHFDSAHKKE